MVYKALTGIEEVLYRFGRSSVQFQGHMGKMANLAMLSVSGRWFQFNFIDGYEIMIKA